MDCIVCVDPTCYKVVLIQWIDIWDTLKADGANVKLVNRQFNSPMPMYSEETIAETLTSQAEVLAQGVIG